MRGMDFQQWIEEVRTDKARLSHSEMLEHTMRHDMKRWLLLAAWKEDAQSIGGAIARMPSRRLARRLADILTR